MSNNDKLLMSILIGYITLCYVMWFSYIITEMVHQGHLFVKEKTKKERRLMFLYFPLAPIIVPYLGLKEIYEYLK